MKSEEALMAISKQEDLKNKKREITHMKTMSEEQAKQLETEKMISELDIEAHKIKMSGFEIINPFWSFEKNPRYTEILKIMTELGHERNAKDRAHKCEQMELNIKSITVQTNSLLESISKIETELKKDE